MCTKTMEPAYTLVKALLFNVCLLVLQSNASTEQIHEINILFIVSFGQSGFNSSGVIPAAEMALEDINNAPDLLPGYKLTYDQVRDSQVSLLWSPVLLQTRHQPFVHQSSGVHLCELTQVYTIMSVQIIQVARTGREFFWTRTNAQGMISPFGLPICICMQPSHNYTELWRLLVNGNWEKEDLFMRPQIQTKSSQLFPISIDLLYYTCVCRCGLLNKDNKKYCIWNSF